MVSGGPPIDRSKTACCRRSHYPLCADAARTSPDSGPGSALPGAREASVVMQVHSTNDGLITSVEVLNLLRDRTRARKQGQQNKVAIPKNRDWVEKEVIKYLKWTSAKGATSEHVTAFLTALEQLCQTQSISFTLAERLQLIDVRPTQPVEVHLLIEECVERLTDDHVEAVLECVNTHLIAPLEEQQQDVDDGATAADTVEGTVAGAGEEEGQNEDEDMSTAMMQESTDYVAEKDSVAREEED